MLWERRGGALKSAQGEAKEGATKRVSFGVAPEGGGSEQRRGEECGPSLEKLETGGFQTAPVHRQGGSADGEEGHLKTVPYM